MGGAGIFRLRPEDANLGAILETVTRHGAETIMAQRYLPEIKDGDKRILVIDGAAVPYCLARIPDGRRDARQPGRRRHRRGPAPDRNAIGKSPPPWGRN
jgi:glutathione synthase/RimK-type ligase-like ATP-grasp enzyme